MTATKVIFLPKCSSESVVYFVLFTLFC